MMIKVFMDLFRPKWKNSNWRKRMDAVKELTDQTILADIAKTDYDGVVRCAAARKLTDQHVLAEIAKADNDDCMSTAAVERLTLQSMLADVASHRPNLSIGALRPARLAALKKLTDEALLAEVAKSTKMYEYPNTVWAEVRAAFGKITRQHLLTEIAKTAQDTDVRSAAVSRLTDQSVLCEIAKADENQYVSTEAVRRLTDQSALGEVAQHAVSNPARLEAVQKITDQKVLAGVATSRADSWVRLRAARQLIDEGLACSVAAGMLPTEPIGSVVRAEAVELLAKLRGAEATGVLIALLSDGDWRIVMGSADALGKRGDKSAIEPLIKVLQTANDHNGMGGARTPAALALGRLGGDQAVSALKAALNDKQEYVREAARNALDRIAPAAETKWGEVLKALQELETCDVETNEQLKGQRLPDYSAVYQVLHDNFESHTRICSVAKRAKTLEVVFDNYVLLAPATRELRCTVVRDKKEYHLRIEAVFV